MPTGDSRPPEEVGGSDGPVVFARMPADTNGALGDEALASGVLERQGDCLLISPAGNSDGERSPIVWPFGTTWTDRESVELPDGNVVEIGSEVELGGGNYRLAAIDFAVGDDSAVGQLRTCTDIDGSGRSVFVVQHETGS